MIERIVLIKLDAAHATDAGRAAVAAHSRAALAEVPGVREVIVSVAADATSAERWDVVLRLRFERLADVEPYRVHPLHVAYVDWLEPRSTLRHAFNVTAPA